MAGDEEKAAEIKTQLEELEERAEELDRRRTNNISSIRYLYRVTRVMNIILGLATSIPEKA